MSLLSPGEFTTGQDAVMRSWTTVRIIGPSMEPALRSGEWWVVRPTRRIRIGHVVAARHPERPDLVVVKRVVRREGSGWWLEGDNAGGSDDSRAFGEVSEESILGVLWWRHRRAPIG